MRSGLRLHGHLPHNGPGPRVGLSVAVSVLGLDSKRRTKAPQVQGPPSRSYVFPRPRPEGLARATRRSIFIYLFFFVFRPGGPSFCNLHILQHLPFAPLHQHLFYRRGCRVEYCYITSIHHAIYTCIYIYIYVYLLFVLLRLHLFFSHRKKTHERCRQTQAASARFN